jgi:hypothetical protein
MPESEKVDVTPLGLRTPEGVARVEKAIEEKHNADALCAVALAELWSMVGGALEDYLITYSCDKEWAKNTVGEIEFALANRGNKNDELLRAVAGR